MGGFPCEVRFVAAEDGRELLTVKWWHVVLLAGVIAIGYATGVLPLFSLLTHPEEDE